MWGQISITQGRGAHCGKLVVVLVLLCLKCCDASPKCRLVFVVALNYIMYKSFEVTSLVLLGKISKIRV